MIQNSVGLKKAEWENKFLEHSPENRYPLYVLYKIPLTQANFLLAQLKMYLQWRVGEGKFPSLDRDSNYLVF